MGEGFKPYTKSKTGILWRAYELKTIFPTQFDGHRFLNKGYMRDFTKLQGTPMSTLEGP